MRVGKERTIYSNYDLDLDQSREALFESLGEDFGWKSADDVPEDEAYHYMYEEDDLNWETEKASMEEFFDNGTFLLIGTIGRWDGSVAGGYIFHSFDELSKSWADCDYICIYDVNGHFWIRCSHHDGTNLFEVKELTRLGSEYADRHAWDMEPREIHKKLWGSSKYSRLPNYANRVYGCKKIEFVDRKSA